MPKKCIFCDLHNSPESTRCSKCGRALDLKTAVETEEREKSEREKLKNELEKFLSERMSLQLQMRMNSFFQNSKMLYIITQLSDPKNVKKLPMLLNEEKSTYLGDIKDV